MTTSRLGRAAALGLALLIAGTAAPPVAADTASDLDDIRRQTAQVRGLEPRGDVPFEIVDRDAFRRRLSAAYEDREGIRELLIGQKFLVALGLLSVDFDLRSAVPDALGDGVAGFYSRREKKMFLVSSAPKLTGDDKITVAHEFTHALQDQHFDLTALTVATPEDDSDRYTALRAVIEGDATLTMLVWGREFLSPEEKAALLGRDRSEAEARRARLPLVLRESFSFPYLEGGRFASSLYRDGGFEAVNGAFREPPRSTEQVIHPEKYLAREAPRSVSMPPLAEGLGATWRMLRTDVMGELDLRALIGQFAPGAADDAAAGWGGDRYAMLEDADGRLIIVLNTLWDTEADAAEFYNAYAPTVATRFGPGQRLTLDEPSRVRWSTPNGPIQLLKTGDRVLVIYAPDIEVLELTAAQFR